MESILPGPQRRWQPHPTGIDQKSASAARRQLEAVNICEIAELAAFRQGCASNCLTVN
jgi:hypothetical protein